MAISYLCIMSDKGSLSESIAELLLSTGAVELRPNSPFTWSSGWRSPIYCDNRVTLSYPKVRTIIKKALADNIRSHYPDATALVGVATAGIAIGALTADVMTLPYAYCRPLPKAHGMQNQLEGKLDKKEKIVIIEDLISTGGSSLKVVEFLRKEGYNVIGLAAIFTYGFSKAEDAFHNAGCPFFSLTNYRDLLRVAEIENTITSEAKKLLEKWSSAPEKWK